MYADEAQALLIWPIRGRIYGIELIILDPLLLIVSDYICIERD